MSVAFISESVILANKIREMKAIKKEKNHKNMQKIVQQTTKVTEKLTKKRHVSKWCLDEKKEMATVTISFF